MRGASFLAVLALAGCGGATNAHSLADLETQVTNLRQEQERQARQLELLENRVVLAEDSARLARQALVGVGSHATVRIGPDGSESREEPIPSAVAPSSVDDEPGANDPEPPGGRPVVHAAGREPIPANPNPIVVRDDDRLPVVPLPPPPATPPPPASNSMRPARPIAPATPRDALPETPMPAAEGPIAIPGAHLAPGTSAVRDPRAAPAYDSAVALARGGHCTEAIGELSAFLVRWPDHPFADHAMYWRGQCLLNGGDARRAVTEFEGLLARFPVGAKVPDALYALVRCYRRLGDEARAHEFATRLQRDFPRSDVAARLRDERTP